jgi:hypothetical protein
MARSKAGWRKTARSGISPINSSTLNIVNTHSETFRKDGTYTLILRLRQNVIKTGIRNPDQQH